MGLKGDRAVKSVLRKVSDFQAAHGNTPFTLIYLRGNWGWTLFGALWGLTVLGVVFKIFFIHRFKILAPLICLIMGWLLIFAIQPAVELIPPPGLQLLLAGGLFYSFGLIFYAWKRLLFHHAIWHLFVLAGSVCHYFAVFLCHSTCRHLNRYTASG